MRSLFIAVLTALLLASPAAILADQSINITVPVGSYADFNIGPVASVTTAEVMFVVDATDSVFDCAGSETILAPIFFVGFEDEGLASSPPMMQYVGNPGDISVTMPMLVFDENAWDILLDGVARVYSETYITDTFPDCVLTQLGEFGFANNSVTLHLVYTNLVGEQLETWSDIKVMYR